MSYTSTEPDRCPMYAHHGAPARATRTSLAPRSHTDVRTCPSGPRLILTRPPLSQPAMQEDAEPHPRSQSTVQQLLYLTPRPPTQGISIVNVCCSELGPGYEHTSTHPDTPPPPTLATAITGFSIGWLRHQRMSVTALSVPSIEWAVRERALRCEGELRRLVWSSPSNSNPEMTAACVLIGNLGWYARRTASCGVHTSAHGHHANSYRPSTRFDARVAPSPTIRVGLADRLWASRLRRTRVLQVNLPRLCDCDEHCSCGADGTGGCGGRSPGRSLKYFFFSTSK